MLGKVLPFADCLAGDCVDEDCTAEDGTVEDGVAGWVAFEPCALGALLQPVSNRKARLKPALISKDW